MSVNKLLVYTSLNIVWQQICGMDIDELAQWRSQDAADARAQHGHTTFVGTYMASAQNEDTNLRCSTKNFGIF